MNTQDRDPIATVEEMSQGRKDEVVQKESFLKEAMVFERQGEKKNSKENSDKSSKSKSDDDIWRIDTSVQGSNIMKQINEIEDISQTKQIKKSVK